MWLVGRHPKRSTLAITGVGGLLLGIVAVATNDGSDAGLGDSFSHAARGTGVFIMDSNSSGVKRPRAA